MEKLENKLFQVTFLKCNEKYIFRYDGKSIPALFRTFLELARDARYNFNIADAVALSYGICKQQKIAK